MHSSGSGDRDATESQDKTTRQIMEWFSEQRGSHNSSNASRKPGTYRDRSFEVVSAD